MASRPARRTQHPARQRLMRTRREWERPWRKNPGRWVFLVRVNGQWGYGTTPAEARNDAHHMHGYTRCVCPTGIRWRGPFWKAGVT
jgi:hypothetical protein